MPIINTFGRNIIPDNDQARLEVLKRYRITDTPTEESFENIATLATQVFNIPIALLSLVDAEKVFFKANIGMGRAKVADRGSSLCALAILDENVTVFEDALNEPCLISNPNVAGEFGLRFYAGAPLVTHDGFLIGTLCIIDRAPRTFGKEQETILFNLAKAAMDQIELRLSALSELEDKDIAHSKLLKHEQELTKINEQLTLANTRLAIQNSDISKANEKLEGTQRELLFTLNQLEESKSLLTIAIEQARLGTFSIDQSTGVMSSSARLKALFGYKANQEMPLGAAIDQIDVAHRERVQKAVASVMQNGNDFDTEYPIISYDEQKVRWVRATGNMFGNFLEGKGHFAGILLDITEQREDEQRKDDFIAMVSHELKSPLSSVSAYVQVLHSRALKNQDLFASDALAKTNLQIKKMTNMINGFLNVSKMGSGKLYIEQEEFDLAELLADVQQEILTTVSTHDVLFSPFQRTLVRADRDKIGHVITNLISNAIKYSAVGTTVAIDCQLQSGRAIVKVRDQGMGISADDIERLFERYYRVQGKDTKSIPGFGIGLYLCAEIIKSHQGKIWADSEIGTGSTFSFSLPTVGY